jgi:hypothetical protein
LESQCDGGIGFEWNWRSNGQPCGGKVRSSELGSNKRDRWIDWGNRVNGDKRINRLD